MMNASVELRGLRFQSELDRSRQHRMPPKALLVLTWDRSQSTHHVMFVRASSPFPTDALPDRRMYERAIRETDRPAGRRTGGQGGQANKNQPGESGALEIPTPRGGAATFWLFIVSLGLADVGGYGIHPPYNRAGTISQYFRSLIN